MLVAIWLGLLLRSPDAGPRLRTAALGTTLGVAALMVAVSWSSFDLRFSQSALAYVVPGGKSTSEAIDRLQNLPPISRGADTAEDLLNRYWPGWTKRS